MPTESEVILDRHLKVVLAFPALRCTRKPSSTQYNFRCNVCGDSVHRRSARSAYILKTKSPWMFYCHRCTESMSAENWLRRYFPEHHHSYLKEALCTIQRMTGPSAIVPDVAVVKPLLSKEDEEETKYFRPLDDSCSVLVRVAWDFCYGRRIPEHIWKKWFVAVGGKYANRLIIPFYDFSGNLCYWQGRALSPNMEPKYLSCRSDKKVFGLANVNAAKPVMVLEGPIDSLFVDNAIALLGADVTSSLELGRFNKVFWFDWDKSGNEHTDKHLSNGDRVFLWRKAALAWRLPQREKWDVNDLYIYLNRTTNFSYEEIEPYVSNLMWDRFWI